MDCISDKVSFGLNYSLDVNCLARQYRGRKRLHISNALSPVAVTQLYQYLNSEIEWLTFLVANERILGTRAGSENALTPDEEREILERAHSSARIGFTSLFDANCSPSKTELDCGVTKSETSIFGAFSAFLNSEDFLGFVRMITGRPELMRIDAQATRFRANHFTMFHDGTDSADRTRKRLASYTLHLTPEWRAEWGGLMEFRGEEDCMIESIVPSFNALDIFSFPQGHWISSVSPFANGPRYAVSGSMYSD